MDEYNAPILGVSNYGDFPIDIPKSGGVRINLPDGRIKFRFYDGRVAYYDANGKLIPAN